MKNLSKYIVFILAVMALLCGCGDKLQKTSVDNTLLMVTGPDSDTDEMVQFMKDMGYYK